MNIQVWWTFGCRRGSSKEFASLCLSRYARLDARLLRKSKLPKGNASSKITCGRSTWPPPSLENEARPMNAFRDMERAFKSSMNISREEKSVNESKRQLHVPVQSLTPCRTKSKKKKRISTKPCDGYLYGRVPA